MPRMVPGANAQRLVVLDEVDRPGALGKSVGAEYFGEIAALVVDLARHDLDRAVEVEGTKFHL